MRKPMRPARHPEMRPEMRPLTDEEGEVRELTAEDFKGMRPIAEVDPGMLEAVAQWRKVGRPKAESPKTHISFRLAAEVVESIKATGEGYNARVEQVLRAAFVTEQRGATRDPRSGSAPEAKLKEMSKSKSVRAMKLPRVESKITERSYQRAGVVAGGTLLSSGARQARRGPPAGEEATEHAIRAVVASQLKAMMEQQHLTNAALAKLLHTSRSQIERVLDPNNDDVTVATRARLRERSVKS
jgi:uncharacterized protein (DUF4415 family)/predicted XRE-type DNA-binding protein